MIFVTSKLYKKPTILKMQGASANQQEKILQPQEESRQRRSQAIYLSGNPKLYELKKFKLNQQYHFTY